VATSYSFSFPGSCSGLDVQVYNAAGSTVGSASTVGASSSDWSAATYSASLTYAASGYTARVTDEHGVVIASAPGVIDVPGAVAALQTSVAALPTQAAFVANTNAASLATVAASVNALRDALIAVGLMAAS
jgi:hypothetical protein